MSSDEMGFIGDLFAEAIERKAVVDARMQCDFPKEHSLQVYVAAEKPLSSETDASSRASQYGAASFSAHTSLQLTVPLLPLYLYLVPEHFRQFEIRDADGRYRVRPPTVHCFPRDRCVFSGLRKCDMVELGFQVIVDLFSIRFSDKIKTGLVSFEWKKYYRSSVENIIALVVNGVANGFGSIISRPDNSLLKFRDMYERDQAKMAHYETMMLNTLIYYFEYAVPRSMHGQFFNAVIAKTVQCARSSALGVRTHDKLWSSEYIENQVSRPDDLDPGICKGHNYQIALLYDRLLPPNKKYTNCMVGIIHDRHPNGGHFLTELQACQMFSINEGRRFWNENRWRAHCTSTVSNS
jgi:hypothetical protein